MIKCKHLVIGFCSACPNLNNFLTGITHSRPGEPFYSDRRTYRLVFRDDISENIFFEVFGFQNNFRLDTIEVGDTSSICWLPLAIGQHYPC